MLCLLFVEGLLAAAYLITCCYRDDLLNPLILFQLLHIFRISSLLLVVDQLFIGVQEVLFEGLRPNRIIRIHHVASVLGRHELC